MSGQLTVDSPFTADWRSMTAVVLVVVIGSVANSAGVGGGAIFVPIFQALVGFGLKESTALSQALITTGSIVNVCINILSPHPKDPNKPIIDFPLVMLLLPMLLVGVGIGVLLNVILPSYILSVLLTLLMTLLVFHSASKGIRMWKAETAAKQQLLDPEQAAAPARTQPSGQLNRIGSSRAISHVRHTSTQLQHVREEQEDESEEARWPIPEGSLNGGTERGSAGFDASNRPARLLSGAGTRTSGAGGNDWGDAGSVSSLQVNHTVASQAPLHSAASVADRMHLMPDMEDFKVEPLPVKPGTGHGWLGRRNAWITRIMYAFNETGAMPSPSELDELQDLQDSEHAAKHSYEPLFQREAIHSWPVKSGQEAHPPAAKAFCRRTMSMPHHIGESFPLLSLEDTAAAIQPRKAMHLGAEQWIASSRCTEAELLEAVAAGGLAKAGGARKAAAAAAADAGQGPAAALGEKGEGRASKDLGRPPQPYVAAAATLIAPAAASAFSSSPNLDGLKCLREEQASGKQDPCSGQGAAEGPHTTQAVDLQCSDAKASSASPVAAEAGERPTFFDWVRRGWARLPKWMLLLLCACWTVYMSLQLARSLSVKCSPRYWALFASQLVAMPMFSVGSAAWILSSERQRLAAVRQREQERERSDHESWAAAEEQKSPRDDAGTGSAVEPPPRERGTLIAERPAAPPAPSAPALASEGPSVISSQSVKGMAFFQVFAFMAGLIAGLLGLGGGMIIGPLLLSLGVQPQVSAASSSCMVLFSSSTAVVSFAVLGRLNLQYTAVFAGAAGLASMLGTLGIGKIIKATGRVSLVVFGLVFIMLVGGLSVGVFGVLTVIDAVRSGNLGPAKLCPESVHS